MGLGSEDVVARYIRIVPRTFRLGDFLFSVEEAVVLQDRSFLEYPELVKKVPRGFCRVVVTSPFEEGGGGAPFFVGGMRKFGFFGSRAFSKTSRHPPALRSGALSLIEKKNGDCTHLHTNVTMPGGVFMCGVRHDHVPLRFDEGTGQVQVADLVEGPPVAAAAVEACAAWARALRQVRDVGKMQEVVEYMCSNDVTLVGEAMLATQPHTMPRTEDDGEEEEGTVHLIACVPALTVDREGFLTPLRTAPWRDIRGMFEGWGFRCAPVLELYRQDELVEIRECMDRVSCLRGVEGVVAEVVRDGAVVYVGKMKTAEYTVMKACKRIWVAGRETQALRKSMRYLTETTTPDIKRVYMLNIRRCETFLEQFKASELPPEERRSTFSRVFCAAGDQRPVHFVVVSPTIAMGKSIVAGALLRAVRDVLGIPCVISIPGAAETCSTPPAPGSWAVSWLTFGWKREVRDHARSVLPSHRTVFVLVTSSPEDAVAVQRRTQERGMATPTTCLDAFHRVCWIGLGRPGMMDVIRDAVREFDPVVPAEETADLVCVENPHDFGKHFPSAPVLTGIVTRILDTAVPSAVLAAGVPSFDAVCGQCVVPPLPLTVVGSVYVCIPAFQRTDGTDREVSCRLWERGEEEDAATLDHVMGGVVTTTCFLNTGSPVTLTVRQAFIDDGGDIAALVIHSVAPDVFPRLKPGVRMAVAPDFVDDGSYTLSTLATPQTCTAFFVGVARNE